MYSLCMTTSFPIPKINTGEKTFFQLIFYFILFFNFFCYSFLNLTLRAATLINSMRLSCSTPDRRDLLDNGLNLSLPFILLRLSLSLSSHYPTPQSSLLYSTKTILITFSHLNSQLNPIKLLEDFTHSILLTEDLHSTSSNLLIKLGINLLGENLPRIQSCSFSFSIAFMLSLIFLTFITSVSPVFLFCFIFSFLLTSISLNSCVNACFFLIFFTLYFAHLYCLTPFVFLVCTPEHGGFLWCDSRSLWPTFELGVHCGAFISERIAAGLRQTKVNKGNYLQSRMYGQIGEAGLQALEEGQADKVIPESPEGGKNRSGNTAVRISECLSSLLKHPSFMFSCLAQLNLSFLFLFCPLWFFGSLVVFFSLTFSLEIKSLSQNTTKLKSPISSTTQGAPQSTLSLLLTHLLSLGGLRLEPGVQECGRMQVAGKGRCQILGESMVIGCTSYLIIYREKEKQKKIPFLVETAKRDERKCLLKECRRFSLLVIPDFHSKTQDYLKTTEEKSQLPANSFSFHSARKNFTIQIDLSLESGWKWLCNNRSFLRISACQLQEDEQVLFFAHIGCIKPYVLKKLTHAQLNYISVVRVFLWDSKMDPEISQFLVYFQVISTLKAHRPREFFVMSNFDQMFIFRIPVQVDATVVLTWNHADMDLCLHGRVSNGSDEKEFLPSKLVKIFQHSTSTLTYSLCLLNLPNLHHSTLLETIAMYQSKNNIPPSHNIMAQIKGRKVGTKTVWGFFFGKALKKRREPMMIFIIFRLYIESIQASKDATGLSHNTTIMLLRKPTNINWNFIDDGDSDK
ncbi:hypothetical protein VP01_241g1 [Puccinia sorghi]|uniref:Uncharacterized protein n=1 Tax=Puccinia sorghi TaxID=27349 RepID=A0A0L6V6J2_9BASI|nr:hypothetical protein VP01_241g1 [Puccinia sorghi]